MIFQADPLYSNLSGMFSPADFNFLEQMNTAPGSSKNVEERLRGNRGVNEQLLKVPGPSAEKHSDATFGESLLPLNFQPRPQDVICGRGLRTKNHPGNKEFKAQISLYIDAYSKAETKFDKTTIVSSILDSVRQKGGLFVKEASDGEWIEVSEDLKRDKIGQAFRDTLHSQYKSSTRAKRRRWKQEEKQRGQGGAKIVDAPTGRKSVAEQIQHLESAVLTNNAVAHATQQLSFHLDTLGGAMAPDESVDMLFHATNRRLLDTIQSNPQLREVTQDQQESVSSSRTKGRPRRMDNTNNNSSSNS